MPWLQSLARVALGLRNQFREENGLQSQGMRRTPDPLFEPGATPTLAPLLAAVTRAENPVVEFGLSGLDDHVSYKHRAVDPVNNGLLSMWPPSILAGLVPFSINEHFVRMRPLDTNSTKELQALKILKLVLVEDGCSHSPATPMLTCLDSFGWLAGLRIERLCLLRCRFTVKSFKALLRMVQGRVRKLDLQRVRLMCKAWTDVLVWLAT